MARNRTETVAILAERFDFSTRDRKTGHGIGNYPEFLVDRGSLKYEEMHVYSVSYLAIWVCGE